MQLSSVSKACLFVNMPNWTKGHISKHNKERGTSSNYYKGGILKDCAACLRGICRNGRVGYGGGFRVDYRNK
jgi:hypothetical protein